MAWIVDQSGQRDAVLRYIRHRLRTEEKEYGRGFQAEVARKTKLSTAGVANILTKDDRGMDPETVDRIAVLWGMSTIELWTTATEWAKTAPAPPPRPTHPARPNLDRAIAFLRLEAEIHDDVIAEVRRLSAASRDFSAAAWTIILQEIAKAHAAEQDRGRRRAAPLPARRPRSAG